MSYGNFAYGGQNSSHGFSPFAHVQRREAGYRKQFGNDMRAGRYNNWKPVKHSGASFHTHTKKGKKKVFILAWNYSKQLGMVNLVISPYAKKGTEIITAPTTKKEYMVWMCTVTSKRGIREHFPVLVSGDGRKAYIKRYGWVVNTMAPNKGYCGTWKKD